MHTSGAGQTWKCPPLHQRRHPSICQIRIKWTSTSGRFCSLRPSARRSAVLAASAEIVLVLPQPAAACRRAPAAKCGDPRRSPDRRLEQPGRADLRRADHPAGPVHHHAAEHHAVEQHLASRRQHAAGHRQKPVAVERQPPDRRAVHHLDRPATGSGCRRPPAGSARPLLARQLRMRGEVPPLAMRRHRESRPHQPYSLRSSSRAGWPETWTMWSSSVMHAHAAPHQAVLHRADRPLVARDHAAGEDHRVALAQRDVRVRVGMAMRDSALRGSPWLPVTDQQQVVVGHDPRPPPRTGRAARPQVAALARRRLQVAQRAPDQRHRRPAAPRPARCSRPAPRCWQSRSPPRGRNARDQRGQAAAHLAPPSRDRPRPWRWCCRTPAPARPRAERARRPPRPSAARPAGRDRASSRRVCSTVPAGVRMHQRLRFRHRVGHRHELQRNGPSSKRPAGGITCSCTWPSSRASPSLRRSTAAANGVA